MKTKKAVAVLMSALIILSSLAVGGFTASASTYSVEQLETLCETYEQKMNGSAYTNMQAAYDAWYDAQAYLVGVQAGMADPQDVDTYYTALETAINNMEPWQAVATQNVQPTFNNEATGTAYDGYMHDGFDYTTNLLYFAACPSYSTNDTNADVIIDMYYPNAVMMYDGIESHTPTMPIMALASKSSSSSRYIYQLYPAESAESNADNPYFRLTENWHGVSTDGVDHTACWQWTMDETNVNGTPQGFAGASSTDNRLGLYRSGASFWADPSIAAMANGMQFVGSMDSGTYSAAYNLDWYRLTGDGADDSKIFSNTSATIYVVNYKALLDAIDGAGLENITSYSYSGATALISAVQTCMNVNPNGYDYASDTAGAVSNCAAAIQSAVNAVNTAKSSLGSMNVASYMTLAGHYADYTATYSAGQGNYTEDSWGAFQDAYEAASSLLTSVVNQTAYMTSASSDALVNAYTNLKENVVPDVTYTYYFANGSSTTVYAPAGTEPAAPQNTATTAAVSNNNGTHTTISYSWPQWQEGTTDYREVPSENTVSCSMAVIEEAVEPTRAQAGKTAVEQCPVCGYTTGGETIDPLGVLITVEQNELGSTTLNSAPTTGDAQKVAYGENYTITAVAADDAEFVGWQVNGKLISTNPSYTTAAYADLTYVPVFAEKVDDFTVTFVDQFNMVLATYTNSELASLEEMPDTYDYLGYDFTGWSMTLDDIKALDENAVVTAYYEKSDSMTFTVNAPGCVITTGGNTYYDIAEVGFDASVTVAPQSGSATSWTVNGNVAAYGAEYTFFVTADVEVAFSGDDVTALPTVAAVDVTPTENGQVRFLATRNVPEGYTLLESGFVYGKDFENPESALVLENANNGICYIYKNSNMANDGQFALTFGITSHTGTAYARAYVIAADSTGNAQVYYADVQHFDYGA